MVNWYCCSSLCYNNHTSKTKSDKKIKFYRVPTDLDLQQKYKTSLKTDGINFIKDGHICYEHWSKGYWNSTNNIPDIAIPACQVPIVASKYKKAKERYDKRKNQKGSDKAYLQKKKFKLEKARTYLNTPFSIKATRKAPKF